MKLTFYNMAALGFLIENIIILLIVFFILFKGISIKKYIRNNIDLRDKEE